MGGVVREFGKLFGQMDTAWVVAFPYWVDTRLVGMNAGMPTRDMAIWPESFPDTLAESRPKMFLVKPEDSAALEQLYQLYPNGTLTVYDSDIPDRDFFIFLVPPAQAPDASFEYLPAEETVPGQ
jgi:hypothetical protein